MCNEWHLLVKLFKIRARFIASDVRNSFKCKLFAPIKVSICQIVQRVMCECDMLRYTYHPTYTYSTIKTTIQLLNKTHVTQH